MKINERLKSLKGDIEYDIQSYIYDKIEEADIPERAKDAIQERIELLVQDVYNLLDIADTDIDDVIQEFTPEELENIKSDLRYERMCE